MRSMPISARRLGAVVVTPLVSLALVSGGGAAVSPAQAAPSNTYSQTGGQWLAGQLTDGVIHNDQWDFDDWGLTLDTFFALHHLGTQTGAQSAILDALEADPEAYISYDTDRYASATGKLVTAVAAGGRTASAFGGKDLETRLESLVHTADDAQQGRGVDVGTDYSNALGQTWVVRGLAATGSDLVDESVGFLLKQQCSAGFFRVNLESTSSSGDFTCDAASGQPSVDTTAFAVQALLDAQAHGVTGLQDDLDDAAAWLLTVQAGNGSFSDGGTPNSNSTGLAAAALATVGESAAAQRAGAWIAGRQVTSAVAAASPALAGEVGAIAYDTAGFEAGKTAGIPVEAEDQWRRASAQALLGIDTVQPLRVSAPTGYVHAGSPLRVTLTNLQPGESWKLAFGSSQQLAGTASSTGTGAVSVTPPAGTRTYTVNGVGTTSFRTGTATVKALGAKKLPVAKRSARVKKRKLQRVTVTGLAAGERATLTYRGQRIWSGKASSRGVVVHWFRVGRSTGVKKVVARGQFSDRVGSTTFRVVR